MCLGGDALNYYYYYYHSHQDTATSSTNSNNDDGSHLSTPRNHDANVYITAIDKETKDFCFVVIFFIIIVVVNFKLSMEAMYRTTS